MTPQQKGCRFGTVAHPWHKGSRTRSAAEPKHRQHRLNTHSLSHQRTCNSGTRFCDVCLLLELRMHKLNCRIPSTVLILGRTHRSAQDLVGRIDLLYKTRRGTLSLFVDFLLKSWHIYNLKFYHYSIRSQHAAW